MNSLPSVEIIGIGVVAVGFGGLFWKLWQSNKDVTDRVISIVEKNAEANVGLSSTLKELSTTVKKDTEMTKSNKEATDNFTQLLISIIKDKNNGG